MIEDYKKALRQGERDSKADVAAGRYPHPPVLDELVPSNRSFGQKSLGIMQIPLAMVVGTRTAGRQDAFSRTFMPMLGVRTEFATKWSHLYDAQMGEGFRDPVKVYEYLHRFYVEEGNKRTSVLKYLESPSIEADVIRILPEVRPTPERASGDAPGEKGAALADEGEDVAPGVDLYREFLEFWNAVPTYDIEFTKPGSYRRLASHLGRDLDSPWPEDAVRQLRSTYLFFRSVYLKAGGAHLDITPADAMLTYMDVYGSSRMLETPSPLLRTRLARIWAEFASSGPSSAPVLVGEPVKESGGAMSFLSGGSGYTSQRPLVAAFAYAGSLEDDFWARAHDRGRQELERHYGGIVRTLSYGGCESEAAFAAAVSDAASQGAEVFFSCSPELMDVTVRAAAEFPHTSFLNCSVNLSHGLVRSYYGRMYEAKFIAGALAASLADNHVIAYRVSLPPCGAVAEANAFAEGVAMVDPKAKVVLEWTDHGVSGIEDLVEKGITMISGADVTAPFDDPLAHGLFKVVDGKVRNIAVPTWNWGRYYQIIVDSLLKGELPGILTQDGDGLPAGPRAVTYWYGMSSGVIDLMLSPELPYGSRKLAGVLRRAISSGAVTPFDGELLDRDGIVRSGEADRLTSNQIVGMDWLAQNIEGDFPQDLRPARVATAGLGVDADV
ncbi:BMP family ABC transporter substrate-binding protein [Parafannyhessea umbonata]|uniref:Basic membrane lipoprotein Med, substrate-binding protein (PBP1-ABC) superfamily n=1 Tax=Parafannyhessea umbonata TaxID=604330 RepID=A0A1H1MXJ9_9ACTN|nr:BMP family ABC transporter substrate-binding protein [Parafannyhessea umbonata]SDR91357.1 Basic membrane lipoprotein Med, substrate-binding protein (PBP1-ABC) superfamily [Parafannyhessea umbonata]